MNETTKKKASKLQILSVVMVTLHRKYQYSTKQ
jgi:hypothetical protein